MSYSVSKIAQELGLSKATVSMVINGKAAKARISPEVEKQVLDFCKKVNYVPNIHAQRINRAFSGTFGFLVKQKLTAENDSPFADMNISEILRGITLEAQKLGCRTSIQLYNDKSDDDKVFEWLRSREIDGLIYYGIDIPEEWRKIFERESRSVVGIGAKPSHGTSSVNIDNYNISAEITKYLLKKGRKSFVYVSGIKGNYVSDERERGCLDVFKAHALQIPAENIVYADFSQVKAEELIFNLAPKVDAVICANDEMAFGTLKALERLNIKVPQKTAVVGGDNIAICEYVSPKLTSFENMCYDMGAEAVKVIADMIHTGGFYNKIIKSRIVIREST